MVIKITIIKIVIKIIIIIATITIVISNEIIQIIVAVAGKAVTKNRFFVFYTTRCRILWHFQPNNS